MTQLQPIATRLAEALTVLACYIEDDCELSDGISETDLIDAIGDGRLAACDLNRWLQEHALNQQALPLEPSPPAEPDACLWQEDDDGVFETACGEWHSFLNGSIKHHNFRYCPYCGAPIDHQPHRS